MTHVNVSAELTRVRESWGSLGFADSPLETVQFKSLDAEALTELADDAKEWANSVWSDSLDDYNKAKKPWERATTERDKVLSNPNSSAEKIANAVGKAEEAASPFYATKAVVLRARAVEEFGRFLPLLVSGNAAHAAQAVERFDSVDKWAWAVTGAVRPR